MAFYVARVDSEGREVDRAYLANSPLGGGRGSGGRSANCAGIKIRYPDEQHSYRRCNAGVFQEHGVPMKSNESSPDVLTSSFSSESLLSEEEEESYDSVSVVRPLKPPLCHMHECAPDNDSPSEPLSDVTRRSSGSRASSLTRPSVTSLRTQADYSSSSNASLLAANAKEVQGADRPKLSYNDWLALKNKKIAQAKALRKSNEQRSQENVARRKLLATRKYDEWLAAKVALAEEQQEQQPPKQLRTRSASSIKLPTAMGQQRSGERERVQLSPEEMQHRLMDWENRKIAELERKRLQRQIEEQRRRVDELRRKEANEHAWRVWEATAAEKPKPVPLNCGMLSLRGTVSAIYVNPNEWRSIIEHDESAGASPNKGGEGKKSLAAKSSAGQARKRVAF